VGRRAIGFAVLAALAVVGAVVLAAVRAEDGRKAEPWGSGEYTNIYPADYVGPGRCAECHAKRYGQWRGNLHRAMNQLVGPEAVIGDFDGARLQLGEGSVRFERAAGEYFMTFGRAGEPPRRYRVTRTIGVRYLQEYVGVDVEVANGTEVRLPFGWWVRGGGWFHQQYFDSWYGRESEVDPFEVDDTPWDSRCAWCHNTYPFELRARRSEQQMLGQGTEQYFAFASVQPADTRLPVDSFISVGISCESCHLGGREHAINDDEIRFVPSAPALRKRADAPDLAGGRGNSVLVNTICAQCHSTPADRFPNGGVTRNSSEALDMAAGACMTAIKCTDCHDPHVVGPGATAADQTAHLSACARCHDALAPDHSKHAAASASCLDCHMPKTVQGVGDVVRSHRISTPIDRSMLAANAPNACNLCHLDRSLSWTLQAIEDRWGTHIEPGPGWSLDDPLGERWLRSDVRGYRIAAAAAYARSSGGPAALPTLVDLLDHPVAYDRMWIRFAIEDIVVRQLLYSARANVATIGK